MSSRRRERDFGNRFTVKMQKKLVVLFLMVLLVFAGLSAQLYLITRDNGEEYKRGGNTSYDLGLTLPLPPLN